MTVKERKQNDRKAREEQEAKQREKSRRIKEVMNAPIITLRDMPMVAGKPVTSIPGRA